MERRGLVIVCLYGLALVPRLLMIALRPGDLQSWEYETLAVNIASGRGYVISHFGHDVLAFGDGNLYSFLAGALYAAIGAQPVVLAVAQALVASLIAPTVYLIAERPLGATTAALGAALAALHPGLMAYTLKLHPLGLDAVLLALLVLWSVRRPWSGRQSVVAGLTLGLNLMTRPTYFLAGVVTWAMPATRHHGARRSVVAAVCVAVLVATPWIVRNWVLLGEPVLMSTSFEDIWKGNNDAANGSSYVAPDTTVFDVAPARFQQRVWAADELQVRAVFAEETAEFVRGHPEQFVALAARKFVYFWWLPVEAGLLYPARWLTAYQAYAVVIYAFATLGAIGILRDGRSQERELLLTLASVGLTLAVLHALAYVEGRHRWGMEPLILLVAARGIAAVAAWLPRRELWFQSRVLRRPSER